MVLERTSGAGDLRFYGVVQLYAGLVLVLMLFFPARYTRTSDLGGVVGWYLLAKLLETFDKPIFVLWTHRQRTHAETPSGGNRGVVDFADGPEERTHRCTWCSCYKPKPLVS